MKLKSPRDLVHSQRPREKLLERGAEVLTTNELLQVLIGSGNAKHNVAQIATYLETLLQNQPRQSSSTLQLVPGLGKVSVCRILAAAEIGRRMQNQTRHRYTTPQQILPLVSDLMSKKKEYLVVISINGAQELINRHIISIGTLNSTLIHPREVFLPAIKDYAAGIFLVHNHPSGDTTPSQEDIKVTQHIDKAAKLIGIKLLDHLIVSPHEEFYSFRVEGKL